QQRAFRRDAVDRAVLAVLGLRHEIERDQLGIRAGARGDHHELARAGNAVDPHLADELALRLLDERVPWADDYVNRVHRLGAECQGGDGLGATHPVHLGDLAEHARGENYRIRPATWTRRRA